MQSSYLSWDEKKIDVTSDAAMNDAYAFGFVATRIAKGVFKQTRSLRIDLKKFELSSENRRVVKKTDTLTMEVLPLPLLDYHWSIGKMGKDFYTEKFGDGTFSANKIKEILTDESKSNFNRILRFSLNNSIVGYTVCLETDSIVHYSYPFYDLSVDFPNLGMGMMLRAITYAKEMNKEYIYLGSYQRPTDTYKLQFSGLEWFTGEKWEADITKIKSVSMA